MTDEINPKDDEIDIHELVYALFRYKWLILGITLVAGVAAFLFVKFGQPKVYAAQAQVIVTKPLYTTNLDPSIQIVPQSPESTIFRDLALADDLVTRVYSTTLISKTLNIGLSYDQLAASMSTKLSGTSKLILEVSTKNAAASAGIANVWAREFVGRINTLYSVSDQALVKVQGAVPSARQNWDDKEAALLQMIPTAQVDARKVDLQTKQDALSQYMKLLTQYDLLASNTSTMKLRLASLPADSRLEVESQLSVIGLYQQAVGGLNGVLIQLTEPTTASLRTVADAIKVLDALTASLDKQRAELQDRVTQLTKDVTDASLALENANYQINQLTEDRDLAVSEYQALTAQKSEIDMDLKREDPAAKIASQALPPRQPVSSGTLLKTAVVGILAFILACFGALVLNWWKAPSQGKKIQKNDHVIERS